MLFDNKYPYTDFHELNLDWILEQVKAVIKSMNEFINLNTIKYADPIEWDITRQYEANTVVIDGSTGDAYISTKPVPTGVNITSTDYWTPIFNYQNQLKSIDEKLDAETEARESADADIIEKLNNIGHYKSTFTNIKNYGAIGDGFNHPLSEKFDTLVDAQIVYPFVISLSQEIDYAAIQKCVNENEHVYIPSGTYMVDTGIVFNNKSAYFRHIVGDGERNTYIRGTVDNINLFTYTRESLPNLGNIITFDSLGFVSNKTNVRAIVFNGVVVGVDRYEDNKIVLNNIYCSGILNLLVCSYCNGAFNNIFAHGCGSVFLLNRAASFMHFNRVFALGCGSLCYADDGLADGISNGLMFNDCQAVFSTGIAYRIAGWQGIYIDVCSADLGQASNSAEIMLYKCSDYSIINSWIANSNQSGSLGIRIWDSIRGSIKNCTISNCDIGLRVDGSSFNSGIIIDSNNFEGCTVNDAVLVSVIGAIITGNYFRDEIPLTGTSAPLYPAGCANIIVKNNLINTDEYTITGISSIVSDNIFNMLP